MSWFGKKEPVTLSTLLDRKQRDDLRRFKKAEREDKKRKNKLERLKREREERLAKGKRGKRGYGPSLSSPFGRKKKQTGKLSRKSRIRIL